MSCGKDKTVRIWNYETYESVTTLNGHTDWVISLLSIQNTKLILSGSKDYTIKIWNYETF